ncbi:MAG: glutamine ABC transporter permease [Candidatus Poribacteria bacterium]|nr:MAG: glutamine ABC transporter permease [Candidatus Poribacteria bacterium]
MLDRLIYLLGGLQLTLALLVCSLAVGIVWGLAIATMRLSPWRPLRLFAFLYVELIRGVPLLVLLLFLFFGLQGVVGRGVQVSAFWSAVAAFGLCYGAFIGEVFRAGIESVDPGQTEAARALGLSAWQTMRHVVLPQAVRNVLPALVNESVSLLKDTSLAAVIALPEVTQRGRLEVARTYETFEVWAMVAAIYLVLTLGLSSLARRLERGQKTVVHTDHSHPQPA